MLHSYPLFPESGVERAMLCLTHKRPELLAYTTHVLSCVSFFPNIPGLYMEQRSRHTPFHAPFAHFQRVVTRLINVKINRLF